MTDEQVMAIRLTQESFKMLESECKKDPNFERMLISLFIFPVGECGLTLKEDIKLLNDLIQENSCASGLNGQEG